MESSSHCGAMYPEVYPGPPISLIVLGKINVAETNEQDFHTGTFTLAIARRLSLRSCDMHKPPCEEALPK